MTIIKTLINLSKNHSSKWSDKKKEAWNEIVDIDFPKITNEMSIDDIDIVLEPYVKQIKEKVAKCDLCDFVFLYCRGEQTVDFLIFDTLINELPFVFLVEDKKYKNNKPYYEFVKWRVL